MIKSEHLICSAGTNRLPELWEWGRPGLQTIYKIINVINNASRSSFLLGTNLILQHFDKILFRTLNIEECAVTSGSSTDWPPDCRVHWVTSTNTELAVTHLWLIPVCVCILYLIPLSKTRAAWKPPTHSAPALSWPESRQSFQISLKHKYWGVDGT